MNKYDTTIRVSKSTRKRLKAWAAVNDIDTQDSAIRQLLETVDAPEIDA